MPKPRTIKSKPSKDTWDLSLLYKSDTDPQIEKDLVKYKKESYRFINKWKDRGDYLSSPKALQEALGDYERWLNKGGILGEIGYYFSLRGAQEENNPKLKARSNQLTDFATKIENDGLFFHLRLAKIPLARQQAFLKNKALARWRHHLKRIFEDGHHLLSESEEKIMNLKAPLVHGKWVELTSAQLAQEKRTVPDRKGKKRPQTMSEILGLIANQNKKIRDAAAAALNDIFARWVDVAEAEMNSILLNKKINDDLRGFARPDAQRHFGDDINSAVVDAMLEAAANNFKLAHRYYKLKARLFGRKTLAYHERAVPYGRVAKTYSYQAAVALVGQVFRRLDPDYDRFFQGFVKNGQIDVFPRAGKSSGAFCAYNNPASPVYILLNHTGELNDVLTLAHEAGHGVNDELMKEAQPAIYFGTSLATAEVASTFTEDFVLEEIMREADDELRLALQMAKLNDDISSCLRQAAAYRFEQELHAAFRRQGYLPKEEIGRLFQKHMKSYMGPAIEQSPGAENWWVYWSHFRNFFYVYSYASGVLISKALQHAVKKDPAFIAKVKEFLRAGSSDSPQNIFAQLGVDITDPKFWRAGLAEIEGLLTATEKLAKKLRKI